jgi:hypothetical protein
VNKQVYFNLILPKKERDELRKAATDLGITMNDLLLYFLQSGQINFSRGYVIKANLEQWRKNGKSIT